MAPGFIDTHVHIESSLVLPAEFEQGVLPRGTTTAICDPHEIANVLGIDGIRYFLAASESLAMTLRVNLSSCVPATELETVGRPAGDRRPAAAARAIRRPLGLAEVMNFPGVLARDPGLLAKLAAFAGSHVDGHAPLLRGLPLNGYLAAGIRTDHECTQLDEAREKLAKGMFILMREGSIAKNVAALAPLLTDLTWPRMAFCTDDRNPLEIVEEGHIDAAMRIAIAAGAPTLAVYRAASLGAATAFGLGRPRRGRAGLPGRSRASRRPGAGRRVAGDLRRPTGRARAVRGPQPSAARSASARCGALPVAAAALTATSWSDGTPVIGAHPFSLITDHLTLGSHDAHGPEAGGARAPRPQRQYRPGLGLRLRAATRRDRVEHRP